MDAEAKKAPVTGSLSVSDALEMYKSHKDYWDENYREMRRDLEIVNKGCWSDDELAIRNKAGKPTLHLDQLSQYINQVVNDIRQNTPSINVIPDQDGDVPTADIFSDYTRAIEYKSSADAAYDTAAMYQVGGGLGFIAVAHDYVSDDSDEQELQIKTVPDPLSVFLDPASVELDGRDANSVVVLEPITKKEFTRLYPKANYTSFTEPQTENKSESIVLGKIYIREFVGKRGKKCIVRAYLFSGDEKLAETIFPGQYIPYIPVYGKVIWVDGKRIVSGLIRNARDAQKRVDHWASKEAEILSMAPIAPVMAVQGTLVNDRGQWQSPGTETVLEYNLQDTDGNQAPPPQRLAPPPVPTGIINALEGAKQNVREALGMYQATVGEKSNETSGIAIQRRQHEGDVATFHFPDNVRRSVQQCGTVIVCAIPEVIDTPRILQTIDNEMSPRMVGVNGAPLQKGQQQPYDLRQGKYHVRVTTGASYTTKRQQESETLGEIIKGNPQLISVIGDLWAKNTDFPGSQALAERFKKLLPAELKDPEDGQAPDPEKQQMAMMIQELQAQLQQAAPQIQEMQQQLKNKDEELQLKAADSQAKAALEAKKLQQQEEEALLEHQVKMQELKIKRAELLIKQQELDNQSQQMLIEHELSEAAAENQHQRDLEMQETSAIHSSMAADQSHMNSLQAQAMQPEQGAKQPD